MKVFVLTPSGSCTGVWPKICGAAGCSTTTVVVVADCWAGGG